MISNRRIIQISLAVVALGLGIVTIYLTGRDYADHADSIDYIIGARMLLENGSYPTSGGLNFFRSPLYPMFMAIVWAVTGESFFAVKIAQAVLHALTAVMIYRTARILTGEGLVATLSGLMFAANPFFLVNVGAIQTEALQTFLLILALMLLFKMVRSADGLDLRLAAGSGAAFGLGALCKNSPLLICIALAVVVAVICYRRKNSLVAAALMIVAMFAVILPWSFYNVRTKGEFILINDSGGFIPWIGNHPANLRVYEGRFSSRKETEEYQEYFKTLAAEQIAEWERTTGYSQLGYKEREALWRNKAIENAKAEPWPTARLLWWKLLAFWRPWLSPDIYSTKAAILSAMIFVPLFILGFAGMWISRRRPGMREVLILFAVMIFVVTGLHTALVATIRLRLPNVDPILTIFAAIAIVAILARYRKEWVDSLNRFLDGTH
jgi:4-amino-4-deoxy-L-arabinose transferase-like glycosyltransferase